MTNADQQGLPYCLHTAQIFTMKQGSLTSVTGIREMYTLMVLQNGGKVHAGYQFTGCRVFFLCLEWDHRLECES